MKNAFLRDEFTSLPEETLHFVPVRLGVKPIASLGISGARLNRQTLEAVSSLVAIAIERARAIEQLGETEAERQGERLKSALLDSIAHDFRTPLTAIKASVTDLLADVHAVEEQHPAQSASQRAELLTIINEECDRLDHLVEAAAEMARLEAGEIQLHFRAIAPADLVDDAIQRQKKSFGERHVIVKVEPHLPVVRADRERASDVLVQLIDNAHLYSPKDQSITISADQAGDFVDRKSVV